MVALVAPAAVGGAEEPGIGKSEGAVSAEAAVAAAVLILQKVLVN